MFALSPVQILTTQLKTILEKKKINMGGGGAQRGWEHKGSKDKMSYWLTSTEGNRFGKKFRGKHVASGRESTASENSLHQKPKRREQKNRGGSVQARGVGIRGGPEEVPTRERCQFCFEKLESRVPGRLGPQTPPWKTHALERRLRTPTARAMHLTPTGDREARHAGKGQWKGQEKARRRW